MATVDSPVTSYTDTVGQMRVITDAISLIDPVDTPLIAMLGLNSAKSKFKFVAEGKKIEWLEDAYAPTADSINGSITSTVVALTLHDASAVQVGDVLQIDAEYMVAGTVVASTNVVTVFSRTFGGTQATHADDAAVTVVGMARLEGADADFGPTTTVSAPYNYTSIYQKGVKATGTMQSVSQYGKANELAYQADKVIPELTRKLERNIFYGIRAEGTAAAPRSSGGLPVFVTNNTVDAGGAIAAADFEDAMEKAVIDGGQPDVAIMHPSIIRDLRDVLGSTTTLTIVQAETRLGVKVTRYLSQFGEIDLVWSRNCPTGSVWLLDTRYIGIYELRPFFQKSLSVTGDADKAEVVGEYSLCVKHDAAHAVITGVTT